VLARDDDYTAAGKPVCDYDDPAARADMVDALARDGAALLAVLDGRELDGELEQAGTLLATVLGQDPDQDETGVFRIARRVAPDRVISTVDPEARHGHKTAARGFDGYKGHIGVDPDSEIVTSTVVSAGNTGDAVPAQELIGDLLDGRTTAPTGIGVVAGTAFAVVATVAVLAAVAAAAAVGGGVVPAVGRARVYGDNAYGTGEFQDRLDRAGIESRCKTQSPTVAGGRFAKDRFHIDLSVDTVRCPAGNTASIVRDKDGAGVASFGASCGGCPLREQCTGARAGRTISVGVHEGTLTAARARQTDPDWIADYRATRPKVERKIGHLMRRKHGGRRARVRGTTKIGADFSLLAAAANLARLATLGVKSTSAGWVTAAR
jgi:hypothetical protein